MMQKLLITLFTVFMIVSCNFENGSEDESGGGLFVGHKKAENLFSLIPPTSKTYIAGENIDFTLRHGFPITVTGSPRISLSLGESTVYATYLTGSTTQNMIFRYTVQPGDNDADGIEINSSLELNGGGVTFANSGIIENIHTAYLPINTNNVFIDTSEPLISGITPPLPNTFILDQSITFSVLYNEVVNVVGTPQLKLNIGGSTAYASYISGSGTSTLTFTYTIISTDVDLDGLGMSSPLELNGGSIKDLNGNSATLTYSVIPTPFILVNGDIPYVKELNLPINKTYLSGETLSASLKFTESVDVTGSPRISIIIGTDTKFLDYVSGTGTDTLIFDHLIVPGEEDIDGVLIGSFIDLNGGTIQDGSLNNSIPTIATPLTPSILVDAGIAEATSIYHSANNTYLESQDIFFTVAFDEEVTITGTPRLPIILNSSNPTPVYAVYVSGSGSENIIFTYTVQSGDLDLDGIEIQNSLDLSFGNILSENNLTANLDISIALAAVNTSGLIIDAAPASVSGITPPLDNSYITSNDLDFTVAFTKNVDILNTPRLQLTIGVSTVYADYLSGTGTSDITFRYTIQGPDKDTNGIVVSNNSIDLNTTGTIKDSYGNSSLVDLSAHLPDLSNILVNEAVVTIISIIPPTDATYIEGNELDFTINTSELINITGTPRFSIDIGGTTKYVDYVSGTGSTSLLFRYTIEAGLTDIDGITTGTTLELNGGTMKSAGLDDLGLTYISPTMTNVLVDSEVPIISSIVPPTDSIYILSSDMDFTVNTDEIVNVTGTPQIAIDIGGTTKYATYLSGTGTSALLFRYTVETNLSDSDGVTISSPLELSGGTIQNTGLENLSLIFTPPITTSVLVDSVVPTISSVTAPIDSSYIESQNIDFVVNVNETVNITGTPRISINIGGVTKYADYLSGTGSNTLTFRYTIEAGLNDSDGISMASLLELSGGTILDITLNPINLNLDATIALPSLVNVLVDTIIPIVAITSANNITAANELTYSVSGTCSEDGRTVSVNIGGTTKSPLCTSGAWDTGATDVSGIADNPILVITADLSDIATNNAIQASTNVDKNTSTPQVAITSAGNITAANQTSYPVSGTCTENGLKVDVYIGSINIQPYCSAGTWTTGDVDVAAIADNAALLITADHSTATQATINIVKDTVSPTVTLSSTPNINQTNETSYVASGTCSENTVMVDINIGSINITPTCSSGSWTTGSIDVSSLADNGSITFSADHSTATQETIIISKNTATPTVTTLTVPTTLKDSTNLNWNLNDPGGFVIDDYEINYRVKGNPTWLGFTDGVSTNINATVTSLLASTTYEFRVRLLYDTSSLSDWSNTAEGETKPDEAIFDSPNAAMNVGGATTTNVVAFYDNTAVTLNGIPIAGSPLSMGETANLTTAQFDIIDADKPIYTAGRRGTGGAGNKANVVWQPTAWAGKNFSFNATRVNPQQLHIYAIENTTIEVKQGGSVLASTTLTAGIGGVISWSVYGSYQVISTGTILAYHSSGDPATTMTDPKPLLPSSYEIIGFPSNSMRLTTDKNSTNYNLIHANSSVASNSLDKADSPQIDPQGGSGAYYQGNSLLISADQKISGASFADSNGFCAAPFLPTNLMRKNYAINVSADYVAFASKTAGTIEVRDSTDTVIETLTLTRSGANPNAPYKARRSTTPAGYRFFATVPVAGWYQPNTDSGAGDEDETVLYGTDL